jgi:acyl-CoA synthetase (NDP forming)
MNNITREFVSEWVAEDSEVPYTELSKVQLAHAYLDATAEVERLRAELARRDEQIAAIRALCDRVEGSVAIARQDGLLLSEVVNLIELRDILGSAS